MKLLSRPTNGPVRSMVRSEPTHIAVFVWHRWRPGDNTIREVIGNRTVNVSDESQMDALLGLRDRLAGRMGRHVAYTVSPMVCHRERVAMADLERFARKVRKIERAYESGLNDYMKSGKLFVEHERKHLEHLFDRAIAKAERTYGHKRSELLPPIVGSGCELGGSELPIFQDWLYKI